VSSTTSEDVASSYSDYYDSSSSESTMTKPASTMEKPTLTARAFARMALGSFSDELQPIRRPLPTFSTDSDSDVSRLFFFMPCIPDVCLVKRLQKAKCGLFSAGVLAFCIFFGRREEQ